MHLHKTWGKKRMHPINFGGQMLRLQAIVGVWGDAMFCVALISFYLPSNFIFDQGLWVHGTSNADVHFDFLLCVNQFTITAKCFHSLPTNKYMVMALPNIVFWNVDLYNLLSVSVCHASKLPPHLAEEWIHDDSTSQHWQNLHLHSVHAIWDVSRH